MSRRDPAVAADRGRARRRNEQRKEGFTMALYVSVCLLAALTGLPDRADRHLLDVLGIVWGTTIGLALAHWFAFRLSARLVESGELRREDTQLALAQLVGAAAIAAACTVPILLLPTSAELDAVRFLLAAFISVVAYGVVRSSAGDHGSRLRALAYAGVVLCIALAVATVKNTLGGH